MEQKGVLSPFKPESATAYDTDYTRIYVVVYPDIDTWRRMQDIEVQLLWGVPSLYQRIIGYLWLLET